MMNYFEFFDIAVGFKVDQAALKRTFYANSKKYHPDFYTLETEEKQQEILELSTLNNEAYKTLSDFDKRMKYILDLKGILDEEGQNKIPQDFLMEMMDINEALMELKFDFDPNKHQAITTQLQDLESAQYEQIKEVIENYSAETTSEKELLRVKDYYLKKRYLLRIQENLEKTD